jgi:GntR family transcriptional regulator / MocR family aminotransferase
LRVPGQPLTLDSQCLLDKTDSVPLFQTNLATTLHLMIDPAEPRARALEAALRDTIREGRLVAGMLLPPSRALADDLGFARATVVEVYAQLQAEGYLTSRRGAGTWVAQVPPAALRAASALSLQPQPGIDFNPGLPDLTAFPRTAWARALRRGLRQAPAATLGFDDPAGRSDLREALAAYLARARGVIAEPCLTVVCAGTNHALALLGRVLHGRGVQSIAMENPCLKLHRDVVANAGLEIVPLPVDEHGARTDLLASLDVGAVVLAPAHQFPLGVQLRPQRRSAAIAWARASNGLVIEDDYDAELRYDRAPIGALQALDPDHVVYVGTTSKTLAPGMRLGWLVVPPALTEPIALLRHLEDMQTAATEQIAFNELLRCGDYERHLRRMRARYRKRRDRFLSVLAERAPSARPVGISAGLRVLLELPSTSPSSTQIAERAIARSISLFPIARCYHNGRVPDGVTDGLVLGYAALAEHNFESGIAALCDFLEQELATS